MASSSAFMILLIYLNFLSGVICEMCAQFFPNDIQLFQSHAWTLFFYIYSDVNYE